MDLDKQFRFDCDFAEKQIMSHGSLNQMFIMHSKTGSTALGIAWQNDAEKQQALELLHLYSVAHDVRAISTLSEAWMTKHDAPIKGPVLRPSKSERRAEIVMITLSSLEENGEQKVRASIREILRNSDGKVVGLGIEDMGGITEKFSGVMVEILPTEPVSQAEQKAAKRQLKRMGFTMGPPKK
jgi:hypothetical protein